MVSRRVPLVLDLWRAGLETVSSCQDRHGRVSIDFADAATAEEFLNIVCGERSTDLESIYNRIVVDEEPDDWERFRRHRQWLVGGGAPIDYETAGQTAIGLWCVDVSFPRSDLAEVERRLRAHNASAAGNCIVVGQPDEIPYDEIDPPIRELVRLLNEEFSGVETIGSCGGHETPISPASLPAKEWYVAFGLQPADPAAEIALPTAQAWLDLEFLTWHINGRLSDRGVDLVPFAPPPHLNEPGRMLRFEIHGWRGGEGGVEPDDLVATLRRDLKEIYTAGGEFPSAP